MDPTLEVVLRLILAAAILAAMAMWEVFAPRRPLSIGRWPRWPSNFGIVVADALLVRLLLPGAAVGAALYAAGQGIGLVEGWRGPVLVALETTAGGAIHRCHAHDPSSLNWPVLEHAVIGH